MPGKSSIASSVSDGVQITLRSTAFEAALKHTAVEKQYEERKRYWNELLNSTIEIEAKN